MERDSNPPSVAELAGQIHASGRQFVLAITGGGTRAISDLLTIPGGSRTVLEAIVPYSEAAFVEFLGAKPEHFCSPRTARAMAMAAFERARKLRGEDAKDQTNLIGFSSTASLASDRPKRGAHRIHVAIQTATATTSYSLELIKDQRTRGEEEVIAGQVALNAIAEACGVAARLPLALLAEEKLEVSKSIAPPEWTQLLLGRRNLIYLAPGDHTRGNPPNDSAWAIFPGAFNPLHEGHRQMADIAAKQLRKPVAFEISIENVDKPPLDFAEMEQRAAQFKNQPHPLLFTRTPTFEKKSMLFPGSTFIVGADTIIRIGEARYYGSEPNAAEAAFQRIADRGCRFLVFGRQFNGKFQSLADLPIPMSLRKLCDEVPEASFRADVSSTELRNK